MRSAGLRQTEKDNSGRACPSDRLHIALTRLVDHSIMRALLLIGMFFFALPWGASWAIWEYRADPIGAGLFLAFIGVPLLWLSAAFLVPTALILVSRKQRTQHGITGWWQLPWALGTVLGALFIILGLFWVGPQLV